MVCDNCSVSRNVTSKNLGARQSILLLQFVLLKDQTVLWTDNTVLANQVTVDSFCFVASQSEGIIVTAGKQLMGVGVEDSTCGTELTVQLKHRVIRFWELHIFLVFVNWLTKWVYLVNMPSINLCSCKSESHVTRAHWVCSRAENSAIGQFSKAG